MGPSKYASFHRLDACLADDFCPPHDLALDDGVQFLRGTRIDRETQLGESPLQLGCGERQPNLRVEALHDVARRRLGCNEAEPAFVVGAADALLGKGRHIRQAGRPLGRGDGQRPQRTRFHLRCRHRDVGHHQRQLATQHVGDGRRLAAIRDVGQANAGGELEQFGRHVRRRAHAARPVVDRARLGFRHVDQLTQRLGLERWRDDQHHRRGTEHGDSGDVSQGVEVDRFVEDWRHGHGRLRGQHQGGAVGRRLGEHVGSDKPAGAGAVVDQHGAERAAGKLLGDEAGRDVIAAACREADQNADRLGGEARRLGAGTPRLDHESSRGGGRLADQASAG